MLANPSKSGVGGPKTVPLRCAPFAIAAIDASLVETSARGSGLQRFDRVKEDLNARVSPYMMIVEGTAMIEMTADREVQLRPCFDAAESLAHQIRGIAEGVRQVAHKATFGIGPAARDIYRDDKFPVLEAVGSS